MIIGASEKTPRLTWDRTPQFLRYIAAHTPLHHLRRYLHNLDAVHAGPMIVPQGSNMV